MVPPQPPSPHRALREAIRTLPGPGDYNIGGTLVDKRPNRKNILLTSSPRASAPPPNVYVPGPGRYNVQTSMIKPSHNAFLATN